MCPPVVLRRRRRRGPKRSRKPIGTAPILGLALGLALAGCGDDGRATTAAHRLIIDTCQERLDQRATAAAIGPDLLVSVAHSLTDARSVEVRSADGESQTARVIALDEGTDIALLRTERPLEGHLAVTAPEGPGPVGILRLDADDRPFIAQGEILELTSVTLDGEGRRAAARLQAEIEPGDSGAAVLDRDGALVAMVFATARDRAVGWAVSATEIERAVDALERSGPRVDPPAC